MKDIRDFRDLLVWQRAMDLAEEIYTLTKKLPREEQFGLTSQLRRAAVSIASNIAEGHCRQGREYHRFLSMAKGSAAEIQTQLIITTRIKYFSSGDISAGLKLAEEIKKMSSAIMAKINSRL